MGHLAVADACRLPDCTGVSMKDHMRKVKYFLWVDPVLKVKFLCKVVSIGHQVTAVDQWLSQPHLPGIQFSTGYVL